MRYVLIFVCVLSWALEAQTSSTRDFLIPFKTDSVEIYSIIESSRQLIDLDNDSAIPLVEKAIHRARANGNQYLLSEAYDVFSMNLNVAGDWQRALVYQDSALLIRKVNGWINEIGSSYNHLGSIYINVGQIHERGEFFDLAEESYTQSLRYFLKAKLEFEMEGDSSNLASVYHNIGNAKYLLYEYDEALEFYKKALGYLNYDGLSISAADVWNSMAVLFDSMDQLDSATYYYNKSAYAYQTKGDFTGYMLTLVNLADLNSDKPKIAIPKLLLADSICMEIGNNVQRAFVNEYLFMLYELEGNYRQSLLHLKVYKAIKDSMLNLDFKSEELKVRYETTKQKEKIQRQRAQSLKQELALQRSDSQRLRLISLAGAMGVLFLISLAVFIWRRRVMRQLQIQKESLHKQKLHELEQKKNLETARAMLAGQEQERIRIAEDLHDRLGSTLSAAKMQMEAAASGSEKSHVYLNKSKGLIDKAIGDTREISHNLISGVLVKLGLVAALEDFKESLEVTNRLKLELKVKSEPNIDRQTQLQLFRITQELVNNAVKHSGANLISIALDEQGGSAYLSVSDNGSGFEMDQVKDGLGLINVRRRIEAIDGNLEVESNSTGSRFVIEIPLGDE